MTLDKNNRDLVPSPKMVQGCLFQAHKLLKELIATYGAEGGEVNAEFGKN